MAHFIRLLRGLNAKFHSSPPCMHPNEKERRWLDKDNTPMVNWLCLDCYARDSGPVIADPCTWLLEEAD